MSRLRYSRLHFTGMSLSNEIVLRTIQRLCIAGNLTLLSSSNDKTKLKKETSNFDSLRLVRQCQLPRYLLANQELADCIDTKLALLNGTYKTELGFYSFRILR